MIEEKQPKLNTQIALNGKTKLLANSQLTCLNLSFTGKTLKLVTFKLFIRYNLTNFLNCFTSQIFFSSFNIYDLKMKLA